MRELITIADQLENFTKELGVSSYAGFLEETNRSIRKIATRDAFPLDIFSHSAATASTKGAIEALLRGAQGSEFQLRVLHENTKEKRVFDQVQSAVIIVFVDETFLAGPELLAPFRQNEQYRFAFFINCTQDEKLAQQASRFMNYRVKSHILSLADIQEKKAEDILLTAIDAQQMDKLKRYTCVQSIKPLFGFMREIIDAENRAANTRKLLNTQNANITRKDEQGMNNNDFLQNLRQVMQKNSQELDKNFKIKYEDLNKPNTGKFSLLSAERVSLLEDFERVELAEKSEKVQTTIAQNYLDEFLKMVSTTTSSELAKDETFIKSSFDDLLSKINLQLKSKNIKPLKEEEIYIPFPDKKRTISTYCYYNRPYVGEIIKKGGMEYFVALRDYTGLIMVVGGLLAPLSIIASASESGWAKNIANWVKGTTAAISLLMIVFGIYDLRRRIPLKRKEEFERELTKARETLIQESKRMFSESSRDWMTNISNWIRDVSLNISNAIDKNVKESQNNKLTQMNTEKMQQQKLQASLENILRGIQGADRLRDGLQNRHRDMITEFEKDLKL